MRMGSRARAEDSRHHLHVSCHDSETKALIHSWQGRLALGLISTAVLLTACTDSAVQGNGDVVTETRTVSEFSAVTAEDGARVMLTIDPTATGDVDLDVTTDSNLLEFLKTDVSGQTLKVSPVRMGGIRTQEGLEVSGTVALLSEVEANNGAQATITGSSGEVQLSANSGGLIDGEEFEVETVTVDVNNGAHVTVCATGTVTGEVTNGASLTVLCGGNAGSVKTSNGGKVSS